MKKILLAISVLLVSANTYADKIIIKGEPVVVEKQGDVYMVPSTTVVSGPEYFFTVNNTKQVCYKEVQPALSKVDLGIVAFKIGQDTVSLHCYTYSPDYFVVPAP